MGCVKKRERKQEARSNQQQLRQQRLRQQLQRKTRKSESHPLPYCTQARPVK
jgi:hypothetical protein